MFGLNEEEFYLLSPYRNVDQSSAPIFLLHGTEDEIVPPENAQEMHDKYKELGLNVKLEWVPGRGHGSSGVGRQTSPLCVFGCFFIKLRDSRHFEVSVPIFSV